MRSLDSRVVDIVRDFVEAHRLLGEIAARYREGALRFDEVQELVRESESSVLFRLKERCHALYRVAPGHDAPAIGQGALFDLAVGSLFHEAMKFRENFYQRCAYGPQVQALRAVGVPDDSGLIAEFEKILAESAARIDESLAETAVLLLRTVAQFRLLLRQQGANGHLARYLATRGEEVASVIGLSLDELLREVYGSPGHAYALAGLSFLESGFFAEGRAAIARAVEHGEEPAAMSRLLAYADGMQAYLEGRTGDFVERMSQWLADAGLGCERPLAPLAVSALARVGRATPEADELARRAAELAERARALASAPERAPAAPGSTPSPPPRARTAGSRSSAAR
jgi:hypothetical protein